MKEKNIKIKISHTNNQFYKNVTLVNNYLIRFQRSYFKKQTREKTLKTPSDQMKGNSNKKGRKDELKEKK